MPRHLCITFYYRPIPSARFKSNKHNDFFEIPAIFIVSCVYHCRNRFLVLLAQNERGPSRQNIDAIGEYGACYEPLNSKIKGEQNETKKIKDKAYVMLIGIGQYSYLFALLYGRRGKSRYAIRTSLDVGC
jgi:hypothetical protein